MRHSSRTGKAVVAAEVGAECAAETVIGGGSAARTVALQTRTVRAVEEVADCATKTDCVRGACHTRPNTGLTASVSQKEELFLANHAICCTDAQFAARNGRQTTHTTASALKVAINAFETGA